MRKGFMVCAVVILAAGGFVLRNHIGMIMYGPDSPTIGAAQSLSAPAAPSGGPVRKAAPRPAPAPEPEEPGLLDRIRDLLGL